MNIRLLVIFFAYCGSRLQAVALSGAKNSDFTSWKSALNRYCSHTEKKWSQNGSTVELFGKTVPLF